MADKDIFNVPTEFFDTSAGSVQVPSFYYDGSAATAFFWCDYDKVEPKLQGTGLVPCRFYNGKALVSFGFFNYRDTSFGAYYEAILFIAVYPSLLKRPMSMALEFLRKPDRRTMGFFHLDLPLTADLPRAAGRELWGLTKFLADISFASSGNRFEGTVFAPDTGETIITMTSPFGRGLSMPGTNVIFYSNHQDKILKTVIVGTYPSKVTSGKKIDINIGPSSHRMADNLRDIGLNESRPIMLQTTSSLRFRQNASTPVGEWKSPPPPYP